MNSNNESVASKFLKKQAKGLLKRPLLLGTIFCTAVLVVLTIGVVSSLFSNSSGGGGGGAVDFTGGDLPLSEKVLQYKSIAQKECAKNDIPEMLPWVLGIIETETHGEGEDVMQSSESAGFGEPGHLNPAESIAQGVKHLAEMTKKARELGMGNDYLGIVQAYNFSTGYLMFLASHGKKHTIELSEQYSKNVVAPALGNTAGTTYSYVNETSQKFHKPYLYLNGGNYFESYIVGQYVGNVKGSTGSTNPSSGQNPSKYYKKLIKEAQKYEGRPYSWGGSSPATGFDCSGLTSWCYRTVGITLPRMADAQYSASKPVAKSSAKAGDLIFFKGTYGSPDYISHVGIFVDQNTMYDSDGDGIGFHSINNGYWEQHFAGIRRP